MRLKITNERAAELGLLLYADDCINCEFCFECHETYDESDIEQAINDGYECPDIDEEYLHEKMTEEEYNAYRHGGLEVIP